jgi:vacuolar-type H+-ATPase subunit I/STV1
MTLGLCCSLANALHRRAWLDVWGEFVPQLLFLQVSPGTGREGER